MSGAVAAWRDRFLGRGSAAVTVPPLDGALKPNSLLDAASVEAEAFEPDNLVRFGGAMLFSSGAQVMQGGTVVADLGSPVTAMAASADTLAAACTDGTVRLFDAAMRQIGTVELACVTALAFDEPGTLLACTGSERHGTGEWQRDLLEHGRTGALWRIEGNVATLLAGRLAFPFGVLPGPVVAESWAKRIVRPGGETLLDDLPGYPARIVPSSRGGYWLCVFAPRSQLIEFVLREPEYCRAMMAEVDKRYWVAPALRSGDSFQEPMQGGALKVMGVLKPWAPTRSYGLVVELDAAFRPVRSFHSRAGGAHHGITSALEHEGRLWLTSKGGGVVLSLDLDEAG